MRKIFFITGTDTNIGKTYITVGLLKKFKTLNMKTIGLKPVATGCNLNNKKLYNSDALLLQENATVCLTYDQVNPFAIEMATAPSIAANHQICALSNKQITSRVSMLLSLDFDIALIEGIGGWQVPLNHHETMADFAKGIQCPIILVVGLRLGCLSHAILTYQSIVHNSLQCVGWIGNCIDPTMEYIDNNIKTLKQFINVPYLGMVNYNERPEDVVNIKSLLTFGE